MANVPHPTRQRGSRRGCGRSPPAARTPSGSRRWRRRSASPRAASTGTSTTARALLEEMLDTWERASVDEVIERVESEGGDARARLRRLFALASSSERSCLRIDLAVRDWARRDAGGRRAPAARRQPAHGLPALAVRRLLRRRGRGRGPLHARLLAVRSATTSSPPITARAAARTCWSWRWRACWPRRRRPRWAERLPRRHTHLPRLGDQVLPAGHVGGATEKATIVWHDADVDRQRSDDTNPVGAAGSIEPERGLAEPEAEGEGFEPPARDRRTAVFKTAAFDRSATPPGEPEGLTCPQVSSAGPRNDC